MYGTIASTQQEEKRKTHPSAENKRPRNKQTYVVYKLHIKATL